MATLICKACGGEMAYEDDYGVVHVRPGKTEEYCRKCFCAEQEQLMECSVEGVYRSAMGDDEMMRLTLNVARNAQLPEPGTPVTITWCAPRQPHTCKGLEERALEMVSYSDGWDARGIATGNRRHQAVFFCPYCGHDLNKPDPPGRE